MSGEPDDGSGFLAFLDTWNALQGLRTPDLHHRIARWLEACWRDGHRELLLMVFRNAGKSTLVGLFCAWLLARNPDLRILVLAADMALAEKMVRNVRRIVERHPATQHLPPRKREDWARDRFTVQREMELRDPSMLARGLGTNVTGSRADVVVCDDVEVPRTSDTEAKREELRDQLTEIEYVLTPGGLQIYVGTPHSYYSIYADEPRPEAGEERAFLHGFRRLELAILNERGESRWPERFPLARIESIRRRTGPAKFASQMLLRPTNLAAGRLPSDRLPVYLDELEWRPNAAGGLMRLAGQTMVAVEACWDPSFGDPNRGDASVVAAVFASPDGRFWLHRIEYMRFDPALLATQDEATQLCRQVVVFARALRLPALAVEMNGIGAFLPGALRREMREAGLACTVARFHAAGAKHARILEGFGSLLAAGRLQVHETVMRGPFATEMREWRPGSRARDDGLDAVAHCLLRHKTRSPPEPLPLPRDDWRPGMRPARAETDFDI